MGRSPLRSTVIREPVADISPVSKLTPTKKTRLRRNAAQRSMLDIDASVVKIINEQYETDLQWVVDSVLGQPSPQKRMAFEINGWEPVTPDMFDGIFEGMFTRKGHQGEINFEGLVLMYRPMELTKEAQAEDAAARLGAMEAQRSMVMNGVIPGLGNGMDAMHPTAAPKQTFRREVRAPMDIPKD
jgi:hypothetical protein